MTNPKDFLDSYQLMRIQMMLCPTGFLTHCSYHKLKKIVLFLQLYNHPYSGLSSQTQTNLQFVFQLNCMPFSPYSASICVSSMQKILFFEKEQNYLFI